MTTPSATTLRRLRRDAFAEGLAAADAVRLLGIAGDIALLIDADGVIHDAAVGDGADVTDAAVAAWIGHPWIDTVTVESRTKIEDMLRDGNDARRWRQVNHPTDADDLPVRYATVGLADGRTIALGRDMRPQAAAQQRLLQAQQALERDYIRLRHAESRYRLLFDQSHQATLIVDAGTRRIREANAAAHKLLASRPGALLDQPVGAIAATDARDTLIAYFGAAEVADAAEPVTITLARKAGSATVSARAFREAGVAQFLVQLSAAEPCAVETDHGARLSDIVDRMPDAFVLADENLRILAANTAFGDLVRSGPGLRLTGTALGDWLGRPGIDADLILGQLRATSSATNVATVLRSATGGQVEVEVSAVAADGAFGFVIRDVSRRLRAAPEPVVGLTKSVDQLTELVGRMSLKEIVRESTDLIERLCIEAALVYTEDNRASAAEVLGVSRQSLYSKLHRHGLGDLTRGDD